MFATRLLQYLYPPFLFLWFFNLWCILFLAK